MDELRAWRIDPARLAAVRQDVADLILTLRWARDGGFAFPLERRSYATITGKGGRRKHFALGPWRWPLLALAAVALVLSSLAKQTGALTSGFTLHYGIGASDPAIAQGRTGVLRSPHFLAAAGTTLLLGAVVALAATVLGLAVAYVVTRRKGTALASLVSQLAFLPVLIPGIAFGTAYIALFGSPVGPLPALYGTFALLALAGTDYTLPFAVQSGRVALVLRRACSVRSGRRGCHARPGAGWQGWRSGTAPRRRRRRGASLGG